MSYETNSQVSAHVEGQNVIIATDASCLLDNASLNSRHVETFPAERVLPQLRRRVIGQTTAATIGSLIGGIDIGAGGLLAIIGLGGALSTGGASLLLTAFGLVAMGWGIINGKLAVEDADRRTLTMRKIAAVKSLGLPQRIR